MVPCQEMQSVCRCRPSSVGAAVLRGFSIASSVVMGVGVVTLPSSCSILYREGLKGIRRDSCGTSYPRIRLWQARLQLFVLFFCSLLQKNRLVHKKESHDIPLLVPWRPSPSFLLSLQGWTWSFPASLLLLCLEYYALRCQPGYLKISDAFIISPPICIPAFKKIVYKKIYGKTQKSLRTNNITLLFCPNNPLLPHPSRLQCQHINKRYKGEEANKKRTGVTA